MANITLFRGMCELDMLLMSAQASRLVHFWPPRASLYVNVLSTYNPLFVNAAMSLLRSFAGTI